MKAKLISLGLLAAASYAAYPALAAPPQDRAFTVANYPVEATAKNAVAAKDKAIADGQQAAFRSLLKRIVPVTAYNRIDKLKIVKAAEYLEGFAVRSEQNSGTQYIASLDFSFQAEAVRQLLRGEGVPFIDAQAPRTIIIPALKAAASDAAAPPAAALLMPASGTWSSVWSGLDLENTLTPMKLEMLKPVIHPDTQQMVLKGDGSAQRILAGEYKSDQIIFAIAEPDIAGKRLTVSVSGADAAGPINWKRTYKLSDGDMDYTMELAAVVTLGVIEGRWKTTQGDDGGYAGGVATSGGDIAIEVEFASLDEWDDIRGRLLNMPGIDDLSVGTVTDRRAEVSLKYPGGAGLLANELAPQGLTMRNNGGAWLLRSGY